MQVDDSQYWREELVRIARALRPKANPPRWSPRAQNVLERDIAIGFFVVRKLYEHNKLSSLAHYTDVQVLEYPRAVTTTGSRGARTTPLTIGGRRSALLEAGTISYWNKHRFLSRYDLAREKRKFRHFVDLADRFIHGHASILTRDSTRNWSNVYLVNDRDRNSFVWSVSVSDIDSVFISVAQDYPNEVVSFLGPAEENRTQELKRDYFVLGWNCGRHRDRLRHMSHLVQKSTLGRHATIRETAIRCGCSQGLVRRLYGHLLNWTDGVKEEPRCDASSDVGDDQSVPDVELGSLE